MHAANVPSHLLHDVDLPALRPTTKSPIGGEHPYRWPSAPSCWQLCTDFHATIRPISQALCRKPRRSEAAIAEVL